MRARNIKPGFFKNEELAELSPEVRLLFIGLWCLADREGRLEDRPMRIKAELFPYENRNIRSLLDKLDEAGFIHRYSDPNSGSNDLKVTYIVIPKFGSHQHPHPNEKPSVLPAPGDITKLHEDSRTNPADSLLLIPDIRIPDITHSRKKPEWDGFTSFWSLYPRKVKKGYAKQCWVKALKKVSAAEIIAALERQLPAMKKQERQFVLHPSTWLNGECWADEIEDETGKPLRTFTSAEESAIAAALEVYRTGDYAAAQEVVSDELWVEVMRRSKG